MQLFYIILAAAFVITLANELWLPTAALDRIATKHFRRTMGGDPADALRPELRSRARRRGLFIAIGGVIGFALGLALQFSPALIGDEVIPSAIALLTSVACGFTADAVYSLVDSSVRKGPTTRLARVPNPQLSDYVPAASTWIARVYGALPIVTITAMALTGSFRPNMAPGIAISAAVSAALCLLTLVLLEILSARLVARAQFASSEWELRWRDAERALTLRGLSLATVVSAFLFFNFVGFLSTNFLAAGPLLLATTALQFISLFIWIAWFSIDLATGGDKYFLRKLWTLKAPDAVPGTPTQHAEDIATSASETHAIHVELGTNR